MFPRAVLQVRAAGHDDAALGADVRKAQDSDICKVAVTKRNAMALRPIADVDPSSLCCGRSPHCRPSLQQ